MSTDNVLAATECSERMTECEAMAKRASTSEQRVMLLRMAKAWRRLREQIVKDGNGLG